MSQLNNTGQEIINNGEIWGKTTYSERDLWLLELEADTAQMEANIRDLERTTASIEENFDFIEEQKKQVKKLIKFRKEAELN